MIVEFSIVPLGTGDSVSNAVADVLDIVDMSGLAYKLNPMGTVVEGEWDEIMALVKRCHEATLKGAPRVVTNVKIDDRPGRPLDRIHEKTRAVEKHVGRKLNGT